MGRISACALITAQRLDSGGFLITCTALEVLISLLLWRNWRVLNQPKGVRLIYFRALCWHGAVAPVRHYPVFLGRRLSPLGCFSA